MYINILHPLVVALLSVSILSACGGGGGSSSNNNGSGSSQPTPSSNPDLANMPDLFAPADDKVIMFVGQDNLSVGGNGIYNNGYVDDAELSAPAGITTYIGFAFDCDPELVGIATEIDYGAGPINMKNYLDSSLLDGAVIHLSIDMAFNSTEVPVANGLKDSCINQVAQFIGDYPDTLFLVRIGYEFDGSHNHYDPDAFRTAFRRIVDTFLSFELTNFNTVMSSVTMDSSAAVWNQYWPGDEYVHWVGYSYFQGPIAAEPATIQFAQSKNKPVFIAESTPINNQLDELNTQESTALWNGWFTNMFNHIEAHGDTIKAWSFINADWSSQTLWNGSIFATTDSRIQLNSTIENNWVMKMGEERYIHSPSSVNGEIGFPAQ